MICIPHQTDDMADVVISASRIIISQKNHIYHYTDKLCGNLLLLLVQQLKNYNKSNILKRGKCFVFF